MLYAYYKVGDKECAPGKEWAALHHGDLICYTRGTMDKGKWIDGNVPGVRDKIAFAVVEYTDTPEWVARLTWGCAGVEAWLDEEKQIPDKGKWRARRGNIDFATLAAECGDVTLKDRWWAHGESVEPVKVVAPKVETIRDASAITFSPLRVKDLNQVSIGAFLVGPAPTDAYATFALAYADIANLTGDLSFVLNGDVTEVAVATITENLGGFTFTTTSNSPPWGDATAGHAITWSTNGGLLDFQCEGPGSVVVNLLRVATSTAGLAARYGVRFNTPIAGYTCFVHHLMFDGGGFANRSAIRHDANNLVTSINSNILTNLTGWGMLLATNSANDTIENNTVAWCGTGIDCGVGVVKVVRRNVMLENTTDAVRQGVGLATDNYTTDATGADVNWAVGSALNRIGLAAAAFESVDPADGAAYLRPAVRGGDLLARDATLLAANTTDAAGLSWADRGLYVGAKTLPVPVSRIQHLKSTTGISTGIGVGI